MGAKAFKHRAKSIGNYEAHSAFNAPTKQSSIPDFISIVDACKKYHVSKVTINNKIKLFEKMNGREIDRLQSGKFYLINEAELQNALRIKTQFENIFKKEV